MDTLASALQLIKRNCYMAVVDLKDAYYSVPIFSEHRKFLRFNFEYTLYEFTCLPNGLSSAPRVFTKLLKPLFAVLRGKGILLVAYIDDIILIANSKEALELALAETITMVTDLGFSGSMFPWIPDQFSYHGGLYDPKQKCKASSSLPKPPWEKISYYKRGSISCGTYGI
jgi:hypothetical protein